MGVDNVASPPHGVYLTSRATYAHGGEGGQEERSRSVGVHYATKTTDAIDRWSDDRNDLDYSRPGDQLRYHGVRLDHCSDLATGHAGYLTVSPVYSSMDRYHPRRCQVSLKHVVNSNCDEIATGSLHTTHPRGVKQVCYTPAAYTVNDFPVSVIAGVFSPPNNRRGSNDHGHVGNAKARPDYGRDAPVSKGNAIENGGIRIRGDSSASVVHDNVASRRLQRRSLFDRLGFCTIIVIGALMGSGADLPDRAEQSTTVSFNRCLWTTAGHGNVFDFGGDALTARNSH